MKDCKYILFDLDGTLTDPEEGITKSVEKALNYFGVFVESRKELLGFIGPPLVDSFMKYFSFSEEQALLAVEKYREYFSVKGLFENRKYEGVDELLEALKNKGKILILATSKPHIYAEKIMDHFDMSKYFHRIVGPELDGTLNHKHEVIEHIIKTEPIEDLSSAVMIGDRKMDIEGAHKNGIRAIGLTYSFGSREEHEKAGADKIIDSIDELYDILI